MQGSAWRWACRFHVVYLSSRWVANANTFSGGIWALDSFLKPIFHCDAKPFAVGPRIGLDPQRHNFMLGIPTCWYLKTIKFALSPTPNLKFVLPLTRTPNANQWNIGCVGSPCIGSQRQRKCQRKCGFQWNMGLMVYVTVKGMQEGGNQS